MNSFFASLGMRFVSMRHRACVRACLLSLMVFGSYVSSASAGVGAHVTVLSDAEAWKNLPPVEEGFGQPLPVWIRALARSLPNTAAAMIELDYVQRAENPLPAKLRAKLRWIAAFANRCEYAKAYARADYVRAGGEPRILTTCLICSTSCLRPNG